MFRSVTEFKDKADPAPTPAELRLIDACRAGEECVLGDGKRPPKGQDDPERRVRASLIRLLATGGSPECGLHPAGVVLIGARITGELDLSFATTRGRLALDACRFDEEPQLNQARLDELSLEDSHLPGLFAQGARISGSLFLGGITATATIDLNSTRIDGQLTCAGASLDGGASPDGEKGMALNAQSAKVGGGIFLTARNQEKGLQGFTAKGTVFLVGAEITGPLDCSGASLDGGKGKALNLQGAKVVGGVFLRTLEHIGQIQSFSAKGAVFLVGAEITGQLACEGATLDGGAGDALNLQGAKVAGGVILRALEHNGQIQSFTAKGTVFLAGAEITGQLDCSGASLDGGKGKALNAQGVKVRGSVFLCALEHNGQILSFTANGTVFLIGAEITGQLACIGVNLNGREEDAMTLQGAKMGDVFIFQLVDTVAGRVDLNTAHVGTLVDDAASWGKCKGGWNLSGLTYDRIERFGPKTFAERKEWLEKGSLVGTEFDPQPYTQLARVLAATGDMGEARKVLFAREESLAWHLRRKGYLRPDGVFYFPLENLWADAKFVLHWFWDLCLRIFAGYGYDPKRALIWMVLLIGLASFVAGKAYDNGQFAPNSDVILVSDGWQALLARDCLADGPDLPVPGDCDRNPAATWANDPMNGLDWDSFSALGYGADLVIPILDLGQTAAWAPSKDRGGWGHALWWGRWVLAGMGWLVTALGAAAVTGIMQRGRPD